MSEERKLFQDNGQFWMELYPHELEMHGENVRFFGTVPCSPVRLVRKERTVAAGDDFIFKKIPITECKEGS